MEQLKRTILGIFLVLFSVLTFAQNGSFVGIVRDESNSQPLEYANVVVYFSSDSSIVSGGVTSATGNFKIEKLKQGQYFLRAQFLGYETKQTEVFELKDHLRLNVGTIALDPAGELVEEVNVTGARINTISKIDKQTFSAEQFESARGGNAVDVLKNMPSVAVNAEGDITVRGSGGFLLLLNGKPVLSDAQAALSQIPANAIKNIELITSPSAKYDPDGKAGIINVTTKNAHNSGSGVIVNAKYGLPGTTDFGNDREAKRFGGDLTYSYQKGKWDITLGGNYNRNDLQGYRVGNMWIKNPENNTINYMSSEGERSFNRYDYAARASIRFQLNESNVLSAGIYTGKRYQERDANLNYSNWQETLDTHEKIYDAPYYNANNQIKQGTFTLGNIDFTHTFEDQSSVTASALYEYDDLYGNTHNRNLTGPGGTLQQYVQNPYEKPIEGYRLKLDYARKVGVGKLEAGYQFRNDKQDGVFDYSVTPDDLTASNEMFSGTAYSENTINSVYSQYSASNEKLEYIVGLRYEYSRRSVKLSFDSDPHVLKLSNFFPTLNIQYNISPDLKVKTGVSRRIQRSTNNQLNPIPEREHSETLEVGDPDLKPEFVTLAELGLVKSFKGGSSAYLTAYLQSSKDPVQRVNSVFNDSILNRVYTNVDRGRAYGFELGTDLHLTQWWSFFAGGNLFKQTYKGGLEILGEPAIDVNSSKWGYSFNVNTTFNLSSTWSLNGNVNYLSKRPTAQGEDSRYLIPNLSVKKTFLDKRLTATVQWQNIDLGMHESHRQRITTWGEQFYTTTNYIYQTDFVVLNLSYNLNWKNGKSKLPSSEFGDKEF
ncbi:TonB-dependent receptor [Maribellus sp. YY47]|uniref:TonB-dependent receptor n=1 Tax=Maribellus sp. YY47 TaxID=2929486 RepID=UPI002000BEE0|nr:TonB-dependent receptor [Maribellus sp. YY47]MCK3686305.1 TonB-dependent receptor [Maribellus sp. YY47]